MFAIELDSASKYYKRDTGLEATRLTIEAGAFYGILGPVQSGKTTLLRLAMGYIRPTGGHVRVFDMDSVRDSVRIRRNVGYIPQTLGGHSNLTLRGLFTGIRRYVGPFDYSRTAELCVRFGLDMGMRYANLDAAERRRFAIVAAQLNDPPLMLVDEPSLELQSFERDNLFALLHELHQNGTTVVITTDRVEEISTHCTDVAVLHAGTLLSAGPVEQLEALHARRISVEADDARGFAEALGITNFSSDAQKVTFTYAGSADVFVKTLANYNVRSLTVSEPSTESVLVASRITKGGVVRETEV
jgi:ABC-2 type transport system ATP-binding protein